jgi:signal transduction histidine kinase
LEVRVERRIESDGTEGLLSATLSACPAAAQVEAGSKRFEETVDGSSTARQPGLEIKASTEAAMSRSEGLRSTNEELERRIIEVSTAEQERIGRDIHDGIGQQLTALSMLATSLERRLTAAGRSEEAKAARDLIGHLQDTLAQTRALARGLSPVEIDPEGLTDALSALAADVRAAFGVGCRFEAAPSVTVKDEILAMHLYRIAQEAIHNALRHGHPDNIEVRLANRDHALVLSVRDDGKGIQSMEDRQNGLGLHIMRYRAGIIGGRLSIEGPEGGVGTLVRCVVPGRC